MIVIYTDQLTNRLKYVCDFVFKTYLQVDFRIEISLENIDEQDFVIYYNQFNNKKSLFNIYCSKFLHLQGYQAVTPEVDLQHSFLFPAPEAADVFALPFDFFSAVFYCLSFYQAYDSALKKDEHNRIDFKEWNLRKWKMDQLPVVNIWIHQLVDKLNENFNAKIVIPQHYKTEISFDIDHAFQFRNKSFFQNVKSIGADFLFFRKELFHKRLAALIDRKKEPANQFTSFLNLERKHNFFILVPHGSMDSQVLHNQEKLQWIKKLSAYGDFGLHPSYYAPASTLLILNEKQILERDLSQNISKSRQHFLRISFPYYFRQLIKVGISDDYSAGYYDYPGWMAGTGIPFPFYDIENEEITELIIHPFYWMDSMYKFYIKDYINVDVSSLISEQIGLNIQYNNVFHCAFHNDTFYDDATYLYFFKSYKLL